MNPEVQPLCTGCGSPSLSEALTIADQPVILNYRFPTPEASAAVPRRPISLRECQACGLIFNAAFDQAAVPYDEHYENRQSHSEAFARHTAKIARMITAVLETKTPRILELGCGKGEFLQDLVRFCSGTGEGWDTSYEGPATTENITFFKEYLTPQANRGSFEAIVCRHVIEHVPTIGQFLHDLADIAAASGEPYVFLETPRLEWILEHKSAWDVFYEHCNYFSERALSNLCQSAGFKIVGHYPVFSHQYQLLVLIKNDATAQTPASPFEELTQILTDSLSRLETLIDEARNDSPWAIWGAGAKGVCLANRLKNSELRKVFDTNSAKQGFFIPGTHIPIIAPNAEDIQKLGLIVIANPTYETEIRETLESFNYPGAILTLTDNLL